ncbi:MAG: hypothetical protein MJB14_04545 [Spirochaetes bacterium]|nr:hypothetical protein [Spirochaetota bacterium]
MCKKILIIDDDLYFTRNLMEAYLKDDLSFSLADSLNRALNLLEINDYDFILANVHVPGGCCHVLKAELKNQKKHAQVFFMSNLDSDHFLSQEAGETCFLKKDIGEALNRVVYEI